MTEPYDESSEMNALNKVWNETDLSHDEAPDEASGDLNGNSS